MLLFLIALWSAVGVVAKPTYRATTPLEQALQSTPILLDNEEVWSDMVQFDFGVRSARLGVQHRKNRKQETHSLSATAIFAPAPRTPGRALLTTSCGSYTCTGDNADCCYSRTSCCLANTTCCNGKCCVQPDFCVSGTTCCSNEYSEYNGAMVRDNSTHCGGCAPLGSGCCEDSHICGGWGTINGTEVFRNYTQCCPDDEYCAYPGDTCCNHTKVGILGSYHTCKGANREQMCCQGHYGGLGYYYGLDCCDSRTETCCGGFCCPKPEQCCPDRRVIRLNETWYGKLRCLANSIDATIGILVNSMIGDELVGEVAMGCDNCTESFNCNASGTWSGTYSQTTRQAIITSIVWETSPPPPSQCFSPSSMTFGEDHGELIPYISDYFACQTTFFSYRKPVCCGVGATCCGGWCCNASAPVCCGDGQCCPVAPLAVPPPAGAIVGGIIAALAILFLLLLCMRAYRRAPRVERGKQKVIVRRLKPRPEKKVAPPTPSYVTGPEVVLPEAPIELFKPIEEVAPPHYEEVPAPAPQEPEAQELPLPVPAATSPKKTKKVKKLVPVEVEVKKFQTSAMQYLGNVRAQGRGEDGQTRTVAWGEMGAAPSAQKKDGAVEEVVETKVEMREVEVEEEVMEPEPEPIVFVPPPREPTPPVVLPPTTEPAFEAEPEPEYEEVEEEVPVFVREVRIPCFPCFFFDMPTSRAECCRVFKGKKSASWCCCCMRRSDGPRKYRSDDIKLAD